MIGKRARAAAERLARRATGSEEERLVFDRLAEGGFLEAFRGKRILEVGPKHGLDSRRLAELAPSELVLLELPEKRELVRGWLPEVEARSAVRHVEGNLLYLSPSECAELGSFDLVWCLGVLYHNAEQLRLLKRLFDMTAVGGALVLESATTRNPDLADLRVVEIHWPEPYRGVQTITHLPSRSAIASWIEMVGFERVELIDVYQGELAWQRVAFTARKAPQSTSYSTHMTSGQNPAYVVGDPP